ncbi:2TM domain-containing protein [Aquimarina amphilecti]|uniref:2TM domain-containing protein n=1 Tax=Aquimarina amphilecti TaxID=1038014 RepID=A0A1H7PZ67_AQUAM|nr:2TM domain-containing protein [Aquimarina amphilecti]SEL41052.1 2TM domain-containing protein [Aquimarina amphilecti]
MNLIEGIMNDHDKIKAYKKAKKRIVEERSFYSHVAIYIVMNIVIFIFKIKIGDYVNDEGYDNYLPWNLITTPLLWGLGLLGHGLWTFREKNGLGKLFNKSIFSKKWENQKIKEFMDEQDNI